MSNYMDNLRNPGLPRPPYPSPRPIEPKTPESATKISDRSNGKDWELDKFNPGTLPPVRPGNPADGKIQPSPLEYGRMGGPPAAEDYLKSTPVFAGNPSVPTPT